MPKHQLQDLLQELHRSLKSTDELDDETRQAVQSLTEDLQRLLKRDGEISADDVEPVSGNLQELLLQFETEHPQITGILGRLASSLANLGI